MTHWSSLLSSTCEDRDSFLSFYSKTKGILHKSNKGKLIVAKDDVFLKACFSIVIEATELQTEVKDFLRNTNSTYSETLELIHADLRVQTTGEYLCDMISCSGSTAIVRRGELDDDVKTKKTDALLHKTGSFPNNHSKLLPSEYYRYFREWYKVFYMFKADCTPDQLKWIEDFKFNFDVSQHAMWPRNNQHSDARHDGASKQNWNSNGDSRNNSNWNSNGGGINESGNRG